MEEIEETKEERKAVPPYLSFKTFKSFIESLQIGIPSRIDRSLMGTMSGAVQVQLITTLKYLQLISPQGIPTDNLTKLVQAETPEVKQNIFREILTSAYPFLKSGVDLQRTTLKHLQELFIDEGASGETVRKCMSFFISAANEAQIPLSPYILQAKVSSPSNGKKARRISIGISNSKVKKRVAKSLSKAGDFAHILIDKFPEFDPNWTSDVQAKWFEGFDKLMNRLAQPVENTEQGEESEEVEE